MQQPTLHVLNISKLRAPSASQAIFSLQFALYESSYWKKLEIKKKKKSMKE